MPYKNRERLYEAQKKHRIKVRLAVFEFLSQQSCVDCGEKDPIVLDFDHKNPKKKYKPVSKLMSGHWAWKTVEKEIKKCEVRCANCHRRKTYKEQGGWGKSQQVSVKS